MSQLVSLNTVAVKGLSHVTRHTSQVRGADQTAVFESRISYLISSYLVCDRQYPRIWKIKECEMERRKGDMMILLRVVRLVRDYTLHGALFVAHSIEHRTKE